MPEKSEMIREMKGREKIAMLTAYEFTTAHIEDQAGVNVILVGDSAGNVVMGYGTTTLVTMEDMLRFTTYVRRGAKNAFVLGDMPYRSYDTVESAVRNAKLFRENGADGVKIEGGTEKEGLKEIVGAIISEGIPVQGHIGYTPQSEPEQLADEGIVQGKTVKAIEKLVRDAYYLQKAGVFSVVLECVPYPVSELITNRIKIPTIGIGAGPYCDGQVLVVHDLIGLTPNEKRPRFIWSYENLDAAQSIAMFVRDVKEGIAPTLEQSYGLKNPSILTDNIY